MKKSLLLIAAFMMTWTLPVAAEPDVEFFYGEIEAVNVGFYSRDAANPIFCAVQVGTNELDDVITSTGTWKKNILVVKKSNTLRYEILAQLIAAQANGLKINLYTWKENVHLGYDNFNELVEVTTGKPWQLWGN
jgi:hypothetical protein